LFFFDETVFPVRAFIQHVLELVVIATERHVGAEEKKKYDVPIRELEAALASFGKALSSEYRGKMQMALKQKHERELQKRERELRKPTPTPPPPPVPSPKLRLKRGRGEDDDEGVDNVIEDILYVFLYPTLLTFFDPMTYRSRARAKRPKTITSSQDRPAAGDTGPPSPTPASYPSGGDETRSPSSRRKTSATLRTHMDSLIRGSATVSPSPSSAAVAPPQKVTVAMLRALTREVKNKYGSTTSSS